MKSRARKVHGVNCVLGPLILLRIMVEVIYGRSAEIKLRDQPTAL